MQMISYPKKLVLEDDGRIHEMPDGFLDQMRMDMNLLYDFKDEDIYGE